LLGRSERDWSTIEGQLDGTEESHIRGGHGLGATISAGDRRQQAPFDRCSTALDRRSTTALNVGGMSNRARAAHGIWGLAPVSAAVAETVDRGFDWGSAAVGVGAGAAITLLLVALAVVLRGRRTGSHHGGGSPS
jgi:hypothetical protein